MLKETVISKLNIFKSWFLKNTLNIILAIAFLIAGYFVTNWILGKYTEKKRTKYEIVRDKLKDSVIVSTDKAGDVIYEAYEKLIYEISPADKKRADSLADLLKIKEKELDKYIEIISKTDYSKATGKVDTIEVDTSGRFPIYKYSYSDKFIQYKAVASKDSLHFDKLEIVDSLYALYKKKKFGDKEYQEIVIKNINPNTKITGLKSLSFEQPKEYRRISVGVHGGIDVISRKPVISIGVNYDLIRFKKKIN